MVNWARFQWPEGPEGLVQAVSPDLTRRIVFRMIFDSKDGRTLHFRPDKLCEPALLERLCRSKYVRNTVTEIATKALLDDSPRIHGRPEQKLSKLLARALAGKLPKVRTGNFTRFERMALYQITSQICIEFGISRGRSKDTPAPSCACDVVAAAWPDQVSSGIVAVNAVKKAKRELWFDFTDIGVTETHLTTTIALPFWGIGPNPVFTLSIHFEIAKDTADYNRPLWFVAPGEEREIAEQVAWAIEAVATSPPGSDQKLPPFPLPRPIRMP